MAFVKWVLIVLGHAFFIIGALSYNLWAPSAQMFLPDFFYAFLFFAMRQEHLKTFVVYFILNGIFRYHFWGQNALILACEGACVYIAFEVERLWFQQKFLGYIASFSLFQVLFFLLHGMPMKNIQPLHLVWTYLFVILCFFLAEERKKDEFF